MISVQLSRYCLLVNSSNDFDGRKVRRGGDESEKRCGRWRLVVDRGSVGGVGC